MPTEKRKYQPPTLKQQPYGEDVLTASGDAVESFAISWIADDETNPAGEF